MATASVSAQGGMHNLTTLIKRLEAATSRLEDIASSSSDGQQGTGAAAVANRASGASASGSQATPKAQPNVAASPAAPTVATPADDDVPGSVLEFDSIVQEDLVTFERISEALGGLVSEQAMLFAGAFKAQRQVILTASKAKEPDVSSPSYMEVFKDLQAGMEQVNSMRERNRKSPEENHLAMVADGAGVLAWVTIKPKPDEYVGEILGGARMYGNRVLTQYKEKEQIHVDWVTAFVKLCASLKSYIKEFHARGLVWNPSGPPVEQVTKQMQDKSPVLNGGSSAPTPSAGGAAPPPPPPLPPPIDAAAPSSQSAGSAPPQDSMGAVFADLNKGEAVTAGLKKVDKSQMTHKNPALRSGSSVPVSSPARSDSNASRGKSPAPNKKPESMRAKKPPRKELDGNKWLVENYDNESTPIEIHAERQHSILVTRCKAITLRIHGKANAISVDNSSRIDVVFDSLVSTLDLVNCSNVRVQVMETLPSVQMDKVDSAIVFLSKESLHAEVYTSKCSSINITLPPASDQDDSVECPVPEQIKSYILDGKLVSEIVKQEG